MEHGVRSHTITAYAAASSSLFFQSTSLPPVSLVHFCFLTLLTSKSVPSIVGADIFKRALSYPAKLIAKNAGMNGNVVIQKILSSDDIGYGYNAAKNRYEDLMDAGILDPSKVVRCCMEHAASVAKTFLTSDLVVVDTKEADAVPMRKQMPTSGPMPSFGPMHVRTPPFHPHKLRPKSAPSPPLGSSKHTPGAR